MHRAIRNMLMPATRSVALLSLVALAAAGCGAADDDGAGGGGDTIRVAMVCGGMTPMVAQLAINADTFPDGLETEKLCFDSGSDAVQALIGGSLDVFMGSTEHVIATQAQGLKTRGYAGINNRSPYALVTAAGSDVETVADLEGETVGVTAPGSLSDTELQIAVQDGDVDYDTLKVIGAGSGAPMAAAIKQGQIAAGMVSEPQRSQLLATGDYRMIWEPDFDYAAIIAVANSDWVADHADTMRKFLEGLTTASDKAQSDEAWALESMKKEEFPVSDDVLTSAVKSGVTSIPEGLVVSEAVYDNTTKLLVQTGGLDESDVLPYDDVFDFSYLPESS